MVKKVAEATSAEGGMIVRFVIGDRVASQFQRFEGIGGEGEELKSSVVTLYGTVASAWPDESLVEFDEYPGVPRWVQNEFLAHAT